MIGVYRNMRKGAAGCSVISPKETDMALGIILRQTLGCINAVYIQINKIELNVLNGRLG